MPFLWILIIAAVPLVSEGGSVGSAEGQDTDRAEILTRVEPRTYDISCAVSFLEEFPGDQPALPSVRERQQRVMGEFFFPVILEGSYHVVDDETVTLRAKSSTREVSIRRFRRDDGPFGSVYAVGVVPSIVPVAHAVGDSVSGHGLQHRLRRPRCAAGQVAARVAERCQDRDGAVVRNRLR